MPPEYDFHKNKKQNKTYITSRQTEGEEEDVRDFRIASIVIDSEEGYEKASEKSETIIRVTPGKRQEIKAIFYEDTRGISTLVFQKFTSETEKPHKVSFSFSPSEVNKIIDFINDLKLVDLSNPNKINVTDDELKKLLLSEEQVRKLINHNQELVIELAKSEVTREDLVALGYRKRQLEKFHKLLNDSNYFSAEKRNNGFTKNEDVWQKFFESNTWIFGYGLSFLFLSNLDQKKLEQVVKGFNFNTHGKRVDAAMKSRGFISSLCFVEIKTHKTLTLDHSKPYRSGCWSISRELAGAASQVQGTVSSAVEGMEKCINIRDKEGNPTGEKIYSYQPRSFLVVGSQTEFMTEQGVNLDKYRSFELYRKNIISPEIITFDELYERAKFIVDHKQS